MNHRLSPLAAFALAALFASGTAAAQDKAAPTNQQNKMTTCNQEATGKKGDERKSFMKECLSAPKMTQQQSKMTTCNADPQAKTLKGDARKAFMKSCLSAKPAA